jgi:hypothetical protein
LTKQTIEDPVKEARCDVDVPELKSPRATERKARDRGALSENPGTGS